ncbi:orange carotenoid protein N-terminal domain-containing protein [Nodosilinea sp. PGN35]|uniref:orange carotenoid protein N-terminal domain-containing protein n=1 Tax=Nodosilinea sp. PGN35 TaxID=3020489 RepID=UPI0023B27620|nr:orange carotenoid protein N-terminal domain-containing protein [Nodosilinea sp. TSF1-S3]MDF0367008.1 orange carotenoid protein N-terminal domain-containing protein [Nodosilinea sp. TSF1-S3]
MTSYTAVNDPNQALAAFKQLSVDDQLAFLWFVYEQMGESITTAAPGSASSEISMGLYNQVKAVDQQQQLDIMRAIAQSDSSSQISREYGSLSANSKLAFWYFLAQGMDSGEIISMPDDYKMAESGQDLLAAIETMDFESQITVLRSAANDMGSEPASGSSV